MKKHTANLATSLGLFFSVWVNVLIWSGYSNYSVILSLVVFVGLTDLLDGYLARRQDIVSKLGTALDRLRDKIFVCPILANFLTVVFWLEEGLAAALIKASLMCILVIELGLVYVWLYGLTRGLNVSSHRAGKIKQVLYTWAIFLWFALKTFESETGYRWAGSEVFMIFLLPWAAYYALGSLNGYVERYWPSSAGVFDSEVSGVRPEDSAPSTVKSSGLNSPRDRGATKE